MHNELVNGIYLLLKNAEGKTGFDKGAIAENIGRLLIDAKEHDIIKTLFALNNRFIEDYQRELKLRLISNTKTYQQIEDNFGC